MGSSCCTLSNALPGQQMPALAAQAQPQPERSIRCSDCGHGITSPRFAMEAKGAHEHTFRNPAGYSFHVLCFAAADGCQVVGPATLDATWFSGYAWSLALCGECQRHLGWAYDQDEERFFGLIATRLS